jgi:hypothetical protein
VARTQALVQHLGGEFPVGHMGQFGAERQDVEDVDAQGLEGAGLLVGLHQPECRLVRAEIDARVRVEGDDAERRGMIARSLGGERDHLLVAAMDAVEAAHRQGRAPVAGLQVLPAPDDAEPSHTPLRGTMITASPSTTVLPFTWQTVSRVA